MRKYFASVALIVLFCSLASRAAFVPGTSHPLIMLTEYNPWAMVVGSDTPSFALYDDGTLIYWGERNKTKQYLSVHLSGEETMAFLKSIQPDELGKIQESYELTEATDQPTNVLICWTPGSSGSKKISVYGRPRALDSRPQALPEVLWNALKLLQSYDSPKATPWVPDYVEVMVWPYDYAKESIDWPAGLPDLHDPNTVRHNDLYSIFVASSHLEEIKAFLARRGPKQAVKLNNKKWAMSVRLPF